MKHVRKVDGQWKEVRGNPTLDRLDGLERATFRAVMAPGWPEGHAEAFGVFSIDVEAPEGQLWTGGFVDQNGLPAPVFEPKPQPTVETFRAAVIRERTRRLALGFDYDFGDARGVHRIGTTEADMNGWNEVTQWATAMLALDQPGASLTIVTDTGPTEVTAAEWQEVLAAAAESRQPIWQASFALQAMDPIPADYADDTWWP